MAVTTLYQDMALDPVTGDLDFSNGELNFIEDNLNSLRQRLYFRFNIWQGDWYFDETFGFPYRTYISKRVAKTVLDNKIKEHTRFEPDVVAITDFTSKMNKVSRTYECYFTVLTTEGEELSLAFVGSNEFSYPTPNDQGASMCGDNGWITYANKLYYLINFRLPTFGDVTWHNKWVK